VATRSGSSNGPRWLGRPNGARNWSPSSTANSNASFQLRLPFQVPSLKTQTFKVLPRLNFHKEDKGKASVSIQNSLHLTLAHEQWDYRELMKLVRIDHLLSQAFESNFSLSLSRSKSRILHLRSCRIEPRQCQEFIIHFVNKLARRPAHSTLPTQT